MRAVHSIFHRQATPDGRPVAIVALTAVIWREGDHWVSQCVELDVSSFGNSPEEAFDELVDAVCAYLNTLEELDELDDVLNKKGVPVYVMSPPGDFHATVPRDLLRREGAQIRPLEVPVPAREPALA